MKKIFGILFLFIGIVIFTQCKKDTYDWGFCNCNIETQVGEYSGGGNYYKGDEVAFEEVDVQLVIEQITSTNLKIQVLVPDKYSEALNGLKEDSTYYLTINGSNKSLIMNLKRKESELKLIGTAKNFHWVYDPDSTYLVTDKTIAFEVLKVQ